MWICVPHMADDLYVQYLGLLCRIALDPDLTVYLEYSNEVWNGQFQQAQYAQTQGLALGLHPQSWHAGWLYYSQRSVEVFNLFSSLYNQLGARNLVRVLAGQSVNPWVNNQIMDWQNAYQSADAFAVAPYFGGGFAVGYGNAGGGTGNVNSTGGGGSHSHNLTMNIKFVDVIIASHD